VVQPIAIGAVGGSYATETFSLGPYHAGNVSFVDIDKATTRPFDTEAKNVVGLLPLGHGVCLEQVSGTADLKTGWLIVSPYLCCLDSQNAKVMDSYGQESRVKSPLMSLYENRAIDNPVVGVVVQGDTPQLTIGGIDE
jgi:hypothetical protein